MYISRVFRERLLGRASAGKRSHEESQTGGENDDARYNLDVVAPVRCARRSAKKREIRFLSTLYASSFFVLLHHATRTCSAMGEIGREREQWEESRCLCKHVFVRGRIAKLLIVMMMFLSRECKITHMCSEWMVTIFEKWLGPFSTGERGDKSIR